MCRKCQATYWLTVRAVKHFIFLRTENWQVGERIRWNSSWGKLLHSKLLTNFYNVLFLWQVYRKFFTISFNIHSYETVYTPRRNSRMFIQIFDDFGELRHLRSTEKTVVNPYSDDDSRRHWVDTGVGGVLVVLKFRSSAWNLRFHVWDV